MMVPKARTRLPTLLIAALAFSAWGCDSDTTDGTASSGPAVNQVNADTYVAGLAKAGQTYTTRLVESQPVPKDTGLYTWNIALTDEGGAPVHGATVVAEPRMPAHDHGTYPPTTPATALAEEGTFELKDMNLFMPGVWEVVLRIEHDSGTDEVTYRFDIEG